MPESNEELKLPNTDHALAQEDYINILNFLKGKLRDEHKTFFVMRWIKIVLHLEHEEKKNRNLYLRVSILVIFASALTTALTGVNLDGLESLDKFLSLDESGFQLLLFILSLTVTITVGIMNLCKFEDVFWKKRIYAEKFKREGFNFLQLIDNYEKFKNYDEAYPIFAKNIEDLIKEVNEGYLNVFGRGSGGEKKE